MRAGNFTSSRPCALVLVIGLQVLSCSGSNTGSNVDSQNGNLPRDTGTSTGSGGRDNDGSGGRVAGMSTGGMGLGGMGTGGVGGTDAGIVRPGDSAIGDTPMVGTGGNAGPDMGMTVDGGGDTDTNKPGNDASVDPPAVSTGPRAFPGAEGYGTQTPGGRGGKVIFVNNVNDSGPGSLRDAIEQSGPRMVVFRVSGTIEMKSDMVVQNSNITIAGQSAPGDGICLKNYKFLIASRDVVVRHLRFRRGNASGLKDDTLGIESAENVVIDHCSLSWGCDETLNTWHGSKNITVQWSIIAEALHHNDHGFAATLGGVNASYHHLLIANSPGRNPSIAGNNEFQTIHMDFRNSVIFNFGYRTFDGKPSSVNIVGNYFKPGPNSTETNFASIDRAGTYQKIPTTAWYVANNVWEGNEKISQDNALGVTGESQWLTSLPNEFAPVQTVSAVEAYELVLAKVGATQPKRDSVDTRIIKEVSTGQPTVGKGVLMDPADVGGWPTLSSSEAPPDGDHDGIPNSWEEANGLDPNNEADGKKLQADGYSNLEHYLNSIGP